jgi:putative acetyltransferase
MPETAHLRIALEPARQPEVIALVDELDAYQSVLYPPESHHGIDMDALSRPNVVFAVLRAGEGGGAVGCGAVVVGKDYGEIKRMFVRPQFRGRGAAKALLAFLEGETARRGCTLLMLETGVSQPEALALYARCGYARRGPFGDYGNDPLSVFMSKQIGSQAP